MVKIIRFIKNECACWHPAETAWLVFCTLAVLVLSVCMHESTIGIIAAVTSLWYTLLAGKGKISCYFFGVINVLLYGWISLQHRLYGEVMLNYIYYLPMMFVGFFSWQKKLDDNFVICKTRLDARGRIILAAASIAGVALYGVILHRLGDAQPILDSLTTVLSISAMILTAKRCIEQWLLWIIVNSASVYMWLMEFLRGSGGWAMLCMWTLLLLNGIIFFIQWQRDSRLRQG